MAASMNDFNYRLSRLSKDKALLCLVLSAVLGATFALLTTSKQGGVDLYMTVMLPFIGIGALFLILSQLYEAPILPAFCMILMMFLGVALQILLAVDGGDTALADASSLVLYYALGLIIGLTATFCLSTGLNKLRPRQLDILFLGCTVLLYLILVIFGVKPNGTRAWIRLGSMSVQITELTKLLAIIHLGIVFSDETRTESLRLKCASGIMCLHAVCLFFVNELGTLVIITIVFFTLALTYISSGKKLLLLFLAFGVLMVLAYNFCSISNKLVMNGNDSKLLELGASIYDKVHLRLELLVHPETLDPYGAGYQAVRASEALSISGWFGSTLERTVPVVESDYIFVYLCLRMGIVAGIGVILLMILILTSTSACFNNHNRTEVAIGMVCIVAIVVQGLLSSSSAIGLIPTIGISMPLIGKGGSSVVIAMTTTMIALWTMRSNIHSPQRQTIKEDTLCR